MEGPRARLWWRTCKCSFARGLRWRAKVTFLATPLRAGCSTLCDEIEGITAYLSFPVVPLLGHTRFWCLLVRCDARHLIHALHACKHAGGVCNVYFVYWPLSRPPAAERSNTASRKPVRMCRSVECGERSDRPKAGAQYVWQLWGQDANIKRGVWCSRGGVWEAGRAGTAALVGLLWKACRQTRRAMG